MNEEKISKFIKKIRTQNNMTQQEFADKYNVTYQAVSKWENAKNLPDISILKEICNDYNVDLNSLLDVKQKKKNYTIYIVISIIIIAVLISLIFLLNRDDDFNHNKVTSACDNFTVYGSIAYNNNKTSLYISNISYCENNDTLYKKIECSLYEDKNNTKEKIDSYSKENMKLNDFLKTVEFNIEHNSKTCTMYRENALYLEIEAEKEDGKLDYYKIPLKIEKC